MIRVLMITGFVLIASGCGESREVTMVEKSRVIRPVQTQSVTQDYVYEKPEVFIDDNGCQYLVFSPSSSSPSVTPRMAWSRSGAKNFQIGCQMQELQ